MTRNNRSYDVVGELTESYRVFDLADGGVLVLISVPREFRDIFLMKMTELTVTKEELEAFHTED